MASFRPPRDFLKSTKEYQTDIIAESLHFKVNQTLLTSFELYDKFYKNTYIHPVEGSSTVTDVMTGMFLGYKDYYIDLWNNLQKPVAVRMNFQRQCQIHYLGRWTNVSELFQDLSQSINNDLSHLSTTDRQTFLWRKQWEWWGDLGQPFHLLDLPSEIREVIYGFAVTQRIYPYNKVRGRHYVPGITRPLVFRNPNVRLLEVNKQVHKEASHIMFRDCTVEIEYKENLHAMAYNVAFYSRVTKLELALTHLEYFQLFGVTDFEDNSSQLENLEAAYTLRFLNLKELTLHLLPLSKVTQWSVLDGACNKILVDWIFEAAYEWIKGHPVTITGCVKSVQKRDFQAKCDAAREDLMNWRQGPCADEGLPAEWDEWAADDGGVKLVESEPAPDSDTEPQERIRPICVCNPKCGYAGWSLEEAGQEDENEED